MCWVKSNNISIRSQSHDPLGFNERIILCKLFREAVDIIILQKVLDDILETENGVIVKLRVIFFFFNQGLRTQREIENRRRKETTVE